MYCGLLSDLHLEQCKFYFHQQRSFYKKNQTLIESLRYVPPPTQKLDLLLVAGDICEFRFRDMWQEFLQMISGYADRILLVDGNHEAYKSNYQKIPVYVAELESKFPNIKFLDNDELVISDVTIFGGCLWTDFGFNDLVISELSDRYSSVLVDRNLQKIKWLNRKIKGRDIQSLSMKSKSSIASWLERTRGAPKRLLLTHYPPFPDKTVKWSLGHPNSDPSFLAALDLIDCTDCSDLLVDHSDVIVAHGHVHGVGSYHARTGNAVYCNPRGLLQQSELACAEYRILEFTL